MFCYHCQEAKKNIACDTAGICGKKADVSSLHDLLTYALKGLSFYAVQAAQSDITDINIDKFTARALYSMVTNVNFDPAVFVQLISEAVQRREHLKRILLESGADLNKEEVPEEAQWNYDQIELAAFVKKGETVGVKPNEELSADELDLHAAREMLIYAAKGLGSILEHAQVLGFFELEHYVFMHESVAYTLRKDPGLDDILAMNFKCGEQSILAMALLERINIEKFGQPTATKVHLDTWDTPGILVSGHDFHDLQDLLEQSAGSGVDIYTHGEMIAAHGYPAFNKYFNLVANYGGAWQDQKTQFGKFQGPVLVTSNSLQQPKKGYTEKAYTSGMVGWPNVAHIEKRRADKAKDFSIIIEQALQCEPPLPLTEGTVTVGYGRQALIALTEAISQSIKSRDIKRIIVLVGCDGRHKERRYYTGLVEALPEDTLILTAGDTKYRFHQLDLGEINGVPRLLDAGQTQDFYAIIAFLTHLQKSMQLEHLNQLPVSFNIAWYEQHTILMMLSLLALGVKNLRIGPTLPPFFSPGILQKLTDELAVKGIDTPENDIAAMLAGE
ncbi:hydroxylamine reductase [Bathymodiolus platifrons methanotrophic gill symbiont]|uniref:hydroxylamine reductase n=1 Tax=Bathymodiolus platifrons methanotrophic gill symbiont TaxID=113268 RepID=UPI000B40FDAF|nr:hydroxylamine reductase [Bathymodiolus platifrons methanotrophic gill symbiont]GAW85895.1 hydroxylamine reductase [Bathymodiolus platifrons methanotrophic gill symbiont]